MPAGHCGCEQSGQEGCSVVVPKESRIMRKEQEKLEKNQRLRESEDISNPYVIQWCQLNISWVSFGVWGCDLYRSRSTCWVKEADDAVKTLRRDWDFRGIPKTGHESSYKFSWVLLRIKHSSSLPPCPLNVIKNDRTALSFWTTSRPKAL